MDDNIIKHENATSSWIKIRVTRDGKTTTVLIIETNLSLNAEDPNYQKATVDGLVAVAATYIRAHRHIDSVEIEQLRQGSLEVTSIGP